MAVERVLVVVKTYPCLSQKYDELVCTAGLKEDGAWIRLYPVPFRKMKPYSQYRKYDWIELDVVKNTNDFRPESYRPVDFDTSISVVGHVDTKNAWAARKELVLRNVYTDMDKLLADSRSSNVSLAVLKAHICGFVIKEVEREWDAKKLEKAIDEKRKQMLESAKATDFEMAAFIRDEMIEMQNRLQAMGA